MLATPNIVLSVCAHNKDPEYTPVNIAVGKKVANIKEQILYFSRYEEIFVLAQIFSVDWFPMQCLHYILPYFEGTREVDECFLLSYSLIKILRQ
jgi:hypothetical protein